MDFLEKLREVGQFEKFFCIISTFRTIQLHKTVRSQAVRTVQIRGIVRSQMVRIVQFRGAFRTAQFRTVGQ